VGTAWMASTSRQRIVTVEADAATAELARSVLHDAPYVEVIEGTFDDAVTRGPFGLAFTDVAEQKDHGQPVIDVMVPGGLIVLDDFTPEWLKGEAWQGVRDRRREFWLEHPMLASVEVLATTTSSVLLCSRRI
jgi:predicted O-methyltransferase YrrM